MVGDITCKGTSAPGLELSLSTGLLSKTFSSSSVGSLMVTGDGLGLFPMTLVLITGQGSGARVAFFSFLRLRGTGGDSSSSPLEVSTVNIGRFLGAGS